MYLTFTHFVAILNINKGHKDAKYSELTSNLFILAVIRRFVSLRKSTYAMPMCTYQALPVTDGLRTGCLS